MEKDNILNCLTAYLDEKTGKIEFSEKEADGDDFLDFCYGEIGNGCSLIQEAEIVIGEKNYIVWMDEEGKLKNYPGPVLALDVLPAEYHDLVLGNVVVTGYGSEYGDIDGIPAEDMDMVKEYLKTRAFFCRWNGKNGPFLFLERA